MEGKNSSNNSSYTCFDDYDAVETRVIKIIAYCVIILFSLIGNGLVVVVIVRERRLKTNTNRFIVNMCVSDLLTTIFVLPLSTMLILTDEDDWPIPGPFGEFLCKFMPFMQDVSMAVSFFSMTVIAFDRYLAIVYPFKFHIITTTRCYILIAVTWVISMAMHCYYLVISEVVKVKGYSGKDKCRLLWSENREENYRIQSIYFPVSFFVVYAMPLMSIAFFYTRVVMELFCKSSTIEQSQEQRRARNRENREVAIMLIAVVVLFAVSWAPLNTVVFLNLFKWSIDNSFPCFFRKFTFVALFISRSNAGQNAFIYFTFNKRFRNGLKKLFESKDELAASDYSNGATTEAAKHKVNRLNLTGYQNDEIMHLTTPV